MQQLDFHKFSISLPFPMGSLFRRHTPVYFRTASSSAGVITYILYIQLCFHHIHGKLSSCLSNCNVNSFKFFTNTPMAPYLGTCLWICYFTISMFLQSIYVCVRINTLNIEHRFPDYNNCGHKICSLFRCHIYTIKDSVSPQ